MLHLESSVFATDVTVLCGIVLLSFGTGELPTIAPSSVEPSGLEGLPSKGSEGSSVPPWMRLSLFFSFLCDLLWGLRSSVGIDVTPEYLCKQRYSSGNEQCEQTRCAVTRARHL